MAKTKVIPPVPQALLEVLETNFPDKYPSNFQTLEEIRFTQGQLSVVRLLRTAYDQQNKNMICAWYKCVEQPGRY